MRHDRKTVYCDEQCDAFYNPETLDEYKLALDH